MMHHVQTTNSEDPHEKLTTFSDLPMAVLHDGLFLRRPHVQGYIGIFVQSRDETVEADVGHYSYSGGGTSTVMHHRSHVKRGNNLGEIFREKHGFKKLERHKVYIDGFRLETEDMPFGPYSPTIVEPIKEAWKKKIAVLNPKTDIFDAAYYVLLLLLLDVKVDTVSMDEEIFLQLHRLFHSSAAYLSRLLERNRLIRELILNLEGEEDISIVYQMFMSYKKDLYELLHSDLHDRSYDMRLLSEQVDYKLQKILARENTLGLIILDEETALQLRMVNLYISYIFLQLVEDVVPECTLILDYIKYVQEEDYPDLVVRPQTAMREIRAHVSQNSTKRGEIETQNAYNQMPRNTKFKHGMEHEEIVYQDRLVVDVQKALETSNGPSDIKKEFVLMKYLLDIHVDDVWSQFITDISTRQHLAPNPFPRFVTILRQAALKVHLWFEPADDVLKRIFNIQPKIEDPENFITFLPGSEGHGHRSSIALMDPVGFLKMKEVSSHFENTNFIQRKGRFKIAMTLAISEFSSLYGKIDPYIQELTLHEHCFIKGPENGHEEAILIYSNIIIDHLNKLLEDDTRPLQGFYMGHPETRWMVDDITSRRKGFATELHRSILRKENVYIKVYVPFDGWRYLPVIKRYLFHFVNPDESERVRFYEENPVSVYQNIFLSAERAAFHFQQGATPDGNDPFSGPNVRHAMTKLDENVMNEVKMCNWVRVYRYLITRAMMNKTNTFLVEGWRVLHSVAAQLEYLNSLNLSLQELTLYALEEYRKTESRKTTNKKNKNETIAEKLGNLHLITLGKMLLAYRNKLEACVKMSAAMAPLSFSEMIENKLRMLSEWDINTKDLFIKLEPRTIQRLEQVRQMCFALQHTLSAEIHSICPEGQAAVKSIKAEVGSLRPATYEPGHERTFKIMLMASEDRFNEWVYA